MSNLSAQKMLFVDCQTTGATPATAHLLELGWAVGRGCDEVAPQFVSTLLILPDSQPPPPRIQKITGITAEAMIDARPQIEVAGELTALIAAHEIGVAVAHWAQFERTFLSDFFARHPADLEPGRYKPVDMQYICTCQIAKKLYPELPSRAIRAVGGYFGLDVEEMKRSAGHVETTYFIWQKLALELETIGIGDTAELFAWLKAKSISQSKSQSKSSSAAKKTANSNFLLPMERLRRLDLPNQPGVYRMLNSHGKILYVGKATSLKSRVNSYFTGRKGKASKTKELISQVFDLHVSPLATPLEAALLENDLIKQHDPPYNRALKKRDRTLLYFTADFASAAEAPDVVHKIGPFPRGSTIEPLILLADGLRSGVYGPGLFWGLLDQKQAERAVTLFFASQNMDISMIRETAKPISVRGLLALGLALYRRFMLDGLAMSGAGNLSLTYFLGPPPSGDDDDDEVEIDEPETKTEPETGDINLCAAPGQSSGNADLEVVVEPFSDEELSDLVRGLIVGSARAYAVSRTLLRLLDTTISYEEKKRRRRLVFKKGILVGDADLLLVPDQDQDQESVSTLSSTLAAAPLFKPGPRGTVQAVELATYDRMRVLLAEIRRLHNRGHWITLTEAL